MKRMMSFAKISFWILPIFWITIPAFAEGNSCVACHSNLEEKSAAGKAYRIWKDTIHEKSGVSCDRCHGGNPSGKTRSDSHLGMLRPDPPEGLINAARIPELCGRCHEPQLKEFTLSRHYQLIQSRGKVRGPTCITCHGSMHTAVLSPENVADACQRCHNAENNIAPNIPDEAHATLDLIFYAKNTVKWSGEFVSLAKKQGYPVIKAEAALKDAEEKFRLSKIKWHSFDFSEILTLVDGAYESAKLAKELSDQEIAEAIQKKTSE